METLTLHQQQHSVCVCAKLRPCLRFVNIERCAQQGSDIEDARSDSRGSANFGHDAKVVLLTSCEPIPIKGDLATEDAERGGKLRKESDDTRQQPHYGKVMGNWLGAPRGCSGGKIPSSAQELNLCSEVV